MVVVGDVGPEGLEKKETKKEATKSQKEDKGVTKYPITKNGFVYYGAGGDAVIDYSDL